VAFVFNPLKTAYSSGTVRDSHPYSLLIAARRTDAAAKVSIKHEMSKCFLAISYLYGAKLAYKQALKYRKKTDESHLIWWFCFAVSLLLSNFASKQHLIALL